MSDWTIDALKEHFDQRFASSERAVDAALQAVKDEGRKAASDMDKRLAVLNELRGVVSDQQAHFVQQSEYRQAHSALVEKVNDLSARIDRSEGRGSGFSAGWGYLVAAIGAVGVVVSIVFVLAR